MKTDDKLTHVQEFMGAFPGQKPVSRADIRNFYFHRYPRLSDQAFRRMLYTLERQNVVAHLGRDLYLIQKSPSQKKKVYHPWLSQSAKEVGNAIKTSFPYLDFAIWETKILHEFMVHQPGQSQIVVETEKDACASVFNHLNENFPGRVFLDPDRSLMERYVLPKEEAIIISRLVSQAPKSKMHGINYVKLESILVDLLVDKDKYFIFQGQELVSIYENAFSQYLINEKALLRYAGRRKVLPQLKQFIQKHPQIEFALLKEAAR